MQRRLARLDTARKEFIANASHELRTPIFSLGGFVELLQDEELDEETRDEFLTTMREQVDRLQKLTTDLLDLSRLDAGLARARARAGAAADAREPGGRRVRRRGRAQGCRDRGRRPRGRRSTSRRSATRSEWPRSCGSWSTTPSCTRPRERTVVDRWRAPAATRGRRRHRASCWSPTTAPGFAGASWRTSSSASTPATRARARGSGSRSLGARAPDARDARGRLPAGHHRLHAYPAAGARARAAPADRRSRAAAAEREARSRRCVARRARRRARRWRSAAAVATETATAASSTVERTRVQVVEGLGGKNGFDPAAIYERLSPGVVTVTSLFGRQTLRTILGGGGSAGQGSGFVLDGDGYIATNAHVITNGTGEQAQEGAARSSCSSRTATRSRREIVGYDPNADVGVVKVDPKGLELVPLSLGRTARRPRRRSGGGDRQPVRRAGLALDRRRVGEEPHDRGADRLLDQRRDPDRRRDQPRQLRRPAARRPRARDRHQLADPLLGRRQRGSRVRRLGRHRAALDRADPRATARPATRTSGSARSPSIRSSPSKLERARGRGRAGRRGRRRTARRTRPASRAAARRSASRPRW